MFFSDEVGLVFEPFGVLHILLFVFVIVGIILIYIFRKKIRENKYERRIAQGMALFALLWEIGLYIWKIAHGQTEWDGILPFLSLCGITLFIGIYALFFKKKIAFEIGYYWTWGAIASVLFPDILFGADRYRFYQFMIGHMFFFFMYMYMIFVYKWYPTWKSWRRSAIVLFSITVLFIILSNLTNKNIMFMLNGDGSPFGMFEGNGYFLYLLGVIFMSFCIVTIWHVPFIFVNRNLKKIK